MSGWHAPVPLPSGGNSGEAQDALAALLDGLGRGWVPKDLDAGPWGLFYQSCAEGLAAIAAWGEHAFCQGFPGSSTDFLPVYEEILGVVPGTDATEEDRRRVVTALWHSVQAADGPSLRASLMAIDARCDLLGSAWVDEDTTVMGRPFGDGSESYGAARPATAYPAYSGGAVARVLLDLGYAGALSPSDQLAVERVKGFLFLALPCAVDFTVVGCVGFLAGTSPLGYTGGA